MTDSLYPYGYVAIGDVKDIVENNYTGDKYDYTQQEEIKRETKKFFERDQRRETLKRHYLNRGY